VVRVRDIERRHIEAYKLHLAQRASARGKPLHCASVRDNLLVLRNFFERLIEWGHPDAPTHVPIFAGDLPIKQRPLPRFLDDAAAAKLLRVAARAANARSELLFIQHGRPISPARVNAAVANDANDAGLGKVTPHQLRHTLATQAIDRGMSLEAIAALLGHRSMDMTLTYARAARTRAGLAVIGRSARDGTRPGSCDRSVTNRRCDPSRDENAPTDGPGRLRRSSGDPVAEGGGFEPPRDVTPNTDSSRAP
jgi:site-specific recombinase XerD